MLKSEKKVKKLTTVRLMDIKHIVLSGGSYNGIQLVGALFQAGEKFIDFSKIKTVYGTSAGSIVLTMWLLQIDKKDVYEYIIDRPWDKSFIFESNMLSNLITKKGMCDENIINEILTPLLKSKYLNENITLEEFYKFTNIEFHIIATEINAMEAIDFSYKTHPTLSLLDAIYMSSSIPCIFQPKYFNGSYVIDGGLSLHFPIKPCLENGAKKENVFGILITKKTPFHSDLNTSMPGFMFQILNNITRRLCRLVMTDIPYLITMTLEANVDDFPGVINDKTVRARLINSGEEYVNDFLQSSIEELV